MPLVPFFWATILPPPAIVLVVLSVKVPRPPPAANQALPPWATHLQGKEAEH